VKLIPRQEALYGAKYGRQSSSNLIFLHDKTDIKKGNLIIATKRSCIKSQIAAKGPSNYLFPCWPGRLRQKNCQLSLWVYDTVIMQKLITGIPTSIVAETLLFPKTQ